MKALHVQNDSQFYFGLPGDHQIGSLELDPGSYVVIAKVSLAIIRQGASPVGPDTPREAVTNGSVSLSFGSMLDRASFTLKFQEGLDRETVSVMTAWHIASRDRAVLRLTSGNRDVNLHIGFMRMTALQVDALDVFGRLGLDEPVKFEPQPR